MAFNGIFMAFNGNLMAFNVNLVAFNGDLAGSKPHILGVHQQIQQIKWDLTKVISHSYGKWSFDR